MKLVKHISAVLLGLIFLVSTSGFLIYKSHCSCTGNQQVSLFVDHETCSSGTVACCKTEMEVSCCTSEETPQCKTNDAECKCDSQEVTYLKLNNQVVNQEVKFTHFQPVQIFVAFTAILINPEDAKISEAEKICYIDPHPLIRSAHDFLIQIQQLKIPHIA